MRRIFILLVLLLAGNIVFAQTSQDAAVQLIAIPSESPLNITLRWKPITYSSPTYQIWKKAKGAISWGTSIGSTTDSFYVDNAVILDSAYEYLVRAVGSITSYGYIYAGVRNPAIHNRGTLILLVDSTFTDSCRTNIATLMSDLSGDGWQLIRHDFNRTTTDVTVKAAISADYAALPDVKAVLILGHIAVPYSGDLNPDAHPDHKGAWPADIFYSCMTGWTDVTVNNISASYLWNHNAPGDGKWDASIIPSTAQLQVGRVDFYDMPAFAATEVQKMRSYLNKDHKYKMDSLAVRHRGIISDNFGYFSGEAFAANGWRNFSPLVGKDSLTDNPSGFISSLAAESYQWAYGTGGGSFTSAGGIGNTSNFASNPVNGIFTILFGSYFGDWNVTNNFLRAPLCSTTPALTCCWAGRPNWFFHHMALGENIGYATLLSQNNPGGGYQPYGYASTGVHVALMGDVSLRTDYIQPVSNLAFVTPYHAGATISWTASPDPAVIGYYVYRADSLYGHFERITPTMVTTTSFLDGVGVSGLKYYQVRPVKLTLTPSGKYYNLGIGVTDTATVSYAPLQIAPVQPTIALNVYPNPAQNYINVTVHADMASVATMYVINTAGQRFHTVTKQLNAGDNKYALSINEMVPGVYTLVVRTNDKELTTKFVKL